MNHDPPQDLRRTFADAEHTNLLAEFRMNTSAEIELFEEMLDFTWQTGAIKNE